MKDNNLLTKDGIAYIVSRILDYAVDAKSAVEKEPQNLFYQGKRLAYTEMLDVIKNELTVRGEDIKAYGLDFDIDNFKFDVQDKRRIS
ncbi:transposase [Pseudoramibacter faecis]|uniref:transposase n=1 Tax=Pseudoramibacter faecis TaxID=3108534 RepID=UPI002E789C39|nr:transposase [Pseudoramibacter sp. HA2172]